MKRLPILILLSSVSILYGEAGLTSVNMLRTPGSPAISSLKNAGMIMGTGIYYLHLNPATIAFQDYPEFYGSYQTLPFGFDSQNLAYSKPLPYGTAAFGLRYFGSPRIDVYDDNYNKSTTNAYDASATAAYAVHFADVSLGVQGHLIQSRLGDFTARTVALDFGSIFYFDLPSIFRRSRNLNTGIGASVRNLSPGIKYGEFTTALPLAYGGGFYYSLLNFNFLEANMELMVNKYHETELSYGGGMQFTIMKYFVLRGGAVQVIPDGSEEKEISFAGGASILVDLYGYEYDIAYSVEPTKTFGLYHHFGMKVRFGGAQKFPFGLGQGKTEKKTGPEDYEYGDIDEEDKVILQYLRNSIYKFQQSERRNPDDLNELLLYLNKFHVYEIPNPKSGKFRYNKRSGKLFIAE